MGLSDALLAEARAVAGRERTTLRSPVESGLRHEIEVRRTRTPFVLRDASYSGEGLTPEFAGAGWQNVREAAYEGHGA